MLLRVIHLNVHRFANVAAGSSTSAAGSSTVGAVGAALSALHPDLVTLNEVDVALMPGCLESVSTALSLPFVDFFGHVRGTYGNAILSRYPLSRRKAVHLEGGTEFRFPAGTRKFNGEIAKENEAHRIVRGLLITDVELPSGLRPLGVAVTHLDHMDVAQRRTQLRHIVREAGDGALLLMGDLNALTRSDYSDGAWRRLEERARERKWQLPQHGDLSILRDAKFEDVAVASGSEVQLTAPAREPLYRVDYGWLRGGGAPGTAKTAPPGATITMEAARVHGEVLVSDHLPLVVDLQLGEAASGE